MFKGKNKKVVFMIILSSILFIAAGLLAQKTPNVPRKPMAPRDLECFITFTGVASGGTMMLCQSSRGMERCALVDTNAGEPAEKVISRLADAIEETNPFDWLIVHGKGTNRRSVTSSGGTLILPGFCGYTTAGTEIGLGIPQPPYSLTCNYNPEANTISIRWINPSPDEYDSISIGFDRVIQGAHLSGKAESYDVNLIYEQSRNSNNDNDDKALRKMLSQMGTPSYSLSDITADLNIQVSGERKGIHSNIASIHLKNNIQEELSVIPFTSDIAPNWQPWVLDNNEGKIHFEQGIRKEYAKLTELSESIKTPETKPFYQVIKTSDKGGTGGVFRKFIGLTPGHTYRVKTRVAVLSEPSEKNWSVSVHAAPNPPVQHDFTARQMAGLDTLPVIGSAIKMTAVQSKGQFKEISTGKTFDGQEINDITLPAGADSITVWVKCAGLSGLSAALDYISLEDLSMQKP
jgi:hypothetical protein